MRNNLDANIQKDIDNILQISSLPPMLNVICKTTGMRFAAIARVNDEKWVTCLAQDEIDFGLKPGDQLELETTICNEIRQHNNPVIIDNVPEDSKYCGHHTPEKYGFKSYISFPIYRKDGSFFGTLCAIDPEPAKLENKHTEELFQLYTELISFHLESIEELKKANKFLEDEKNDAKLRETFIAILGHDLRNPLSTVRLCVDFLMQLEIPENAKKYISTIRTSSLRMQELIDNLLDFAKGELGEGIGLDLVSDNIGLEKELREIINEFETSDFSHEFLSSIQLEKSFNCDISRIGQLFSNLLSNAVKHGSPSFPIHINAKTENDQFILEVVNSSKMIPREKLNDIFKPFTTNNKENNENGLGLGLFIASEIAKAHGGKIAVRSNDEETSFKYSMPI